MPQGIPPAPPRRSPLRSEQIRYLAWLQYQDEQLAQMDAEAAQILNRYEEAIITLAMLRARLRK